MKLPKIVTLLYVPSKADIDAAIVDLTDAMIERRMGDAWWDDPAVDPELAQDEIDRHWDWTELEIEGGGRVLKSRRLAVTSLPFASRYSIRSAMIVAATPST